VRVLMTLATSLSAVLLATWGSLTISGVIRAGQRNDQACLRWFQRLQQSHLYVWLVTVGIVIYWLQWPQLVRFNWGLDNAVLLRDLLILAPVWAPLLFSWAAFYEVERAVCGPADSSTPKEQQAVPQPGRTAFVALRARHYLGLGLLPILLLLAFQDVATWLKPTWQESEFGWTLYLIPLLVVSLLFPQLLSRIWKTRPLPAGQLRDRLEQLTRRMRVRTRWFRIWETDGQLLNAAVTGLLPPLRCVLLTDGLMALLRDEEVEAVIAHELGHVRRRHLWLRMLLLALPVWVMGNVQAFAPEIGDVCASWLLALFDDQMVVSALVIPALTITYTVFTLGRFSRLLEHDADLAVVEQGHAASFCTTLDRISYITNERRDRRTWLHPSTAARVHFLQRAVHDPFFAARFRRRLDLLSMTLLAAWLLTPLLLLAAF
jgi:Zn-dependent protease with chaperone function